MRKSKDGGVEEFDEYIVVDVTKTSNWTFYNTKKVGIVTKDLGKVLIYIKGEEGERNKRIVKKLKEFHSDVVAHNDISSHSDINWSGTGLEDRLEEILEEKEDGKAE